MPFVYSTPNLKKESEAFATAFGSQPKESIISSLGRVVKVLGSCPVTGYGLSALLLRSREENYSLQKEVLENY